VALVICRWLGYGPGRLTEVCPRGGARHRDRPRRVGGQGDRDLIEADGGSAERTSFDVRDLGQITSLFQEVERTTASCTCSTTMRASPEQAGLDVTSEEFDFAVDIKPEGCLFRGAGRRRPVESAQRVKVRSSSRASISGIVGFSIQPALLDDQGRDRAADESRWLSRLHPDIRCNAICPGPVGHARCSAVLRARARSQRSRTSCRAS